MIKLTAIKPRAKAVQFSRYADAAKDGMRDAAEDARKDFESTVKTWRHDVAFSIKEQKDGFLVGTDDDIFGYVDQGTKPHVIRPHRARLLRFQTGYRAKTTPGRIGSSGGGTSGDVAFARAVRHPGTTARGFSKLIGAKYRAKLQQYISKRIREAM